MMVLDCGISYQVSEVSKDEVLKKEAYIVFYTRESVSGAKLSADNTEADFEGPVWDTYPPSPKMSDSGQSSGIVYETC
ncbi:hypothetical protein QJS04_geneDACA012138 [Acorus gramineus]|uniref:Uncharacterized protein n=1 Tax=Acorus gramineus TaxID=55184 RepID=A0AAV9BCU8_ACOGR|nr:hypothetical protein QJS04_geneDACA012138 [Acorus gramineus]